MGKNAFGIGGNVNHVEKTTLSDYQLEALKLLSRHKKQGLMSALTPTVFAMNNILIQKGYKTTNTHNTFQELVHNGLLEYDIKKSGLHTQQGEKSYEITPKGEDTLKNHEKTKTICSNKTTLPKNTPPPP